MTLTADPAPAWPLAALGDVTVPLTFTALEPVTQGAGNAGNSQLLRTQDVILPDGRRTSVPFVSGSSLRHALRDALAWHLCRTLRVPGASLSKAAVDLLWSGGSITAAGSAADLGLARRVHGRLPGLGMLGYSAGPGITAGVLSARNVHLVCAENAWRLPSRLQGHPHAVLPAGAMRSEEFGTRHDTAASPADRYIALLGDGEAAPPGTQMIYDTQVIKAGSVLWSELRLAAPSRGHLAALATAVGTAAPLQDDGRRVMHLGGKRAQGYAACLLEADLSGLGDAAELRAEYEDRLVSAREEILPLLREVAGA